MQLHFQPLVEEDQNPKIKNTTAYYGGYFDKIVYKWSGNLHDYGLMAKTRRDYGENPTSNKPYTIDFNITSLLEI